jgi:hypothetical protein
MNVTNQLTNLGHGFDITTDIAMCILNNNGISTSWTVQLRGTGDEEC